MENKMDRNDIFITECLKEALDTLKRYRTDPLIVRFMKKYGIYTKGTREERLERIKKKVLEPKTRPSFKNLSDYLDQLKWNGKQHVFLFTLKSIHSSYLEDLRDIGKLKKILSEQGCEKLLNRTERIWEETDPLLVGVTHRFDPQTSQGYIIFKWEETREFTVDEQVSGLGIVAVPKKERSINCFSIDLNTGNAELRLQSLRPRSTRSLKNLVAFYKKEIGRFIEFTYFSPVPMDPIIRKFLKDTTLAVSYWKIAYPQTGELKGNKKLSIFNKLRFLFRPFFSIEMTIKCECDQEVTANPLYFSLHGESDEIRFNSISDWDKVNQILSQLRIISTELLKMKEMKYLALVYPEYLRIISAIDFFFISLKKSKIKAQYLSSMVWYPIADIRKVFSLIVDLFPKKFSLDKNNPDILVMRNCFSLRGGIQDCIKRLLDQTARREIFKPIVTPTLMGVFYLILKIVLKDFINWVFESTMDIVLQGFPLFLVEGIIILFVALLFFGAANLFIKLPKTLYDFLRVLLKSFMGEERLKKNQKFFNLNAVNP